MWKCKECGGTDFKMEIDGFIEIDLKKNGDFEYRKDTLNIRNNHNYITCCKCWNDSEDIEEIAEWVEDNDKGNSQV